jgi:replicative superfamily II helicase
MDDVCYEVVAEALRSGYQVMVFVHSRKGTGTPPRHWQRGQLWKARLSICS